MGMPRGRPRENEFLLAGLLRHAVCGRVMSPAIGPGGFRVYVCRSGCGKAVEAAPLERELLLRALVRAYVALYQVGRPVTDVPDPGWWGSGDGVVVSAEEARRWQRCAPLNRRGMLRTAYARVDVDEDGRVRPVWRHRFDGDGRRGGGGRLA